jgi:hypothetical protein
MDIKIGCILIGLAAKEQAELYPRLGETLSILFVLQHWQF